MWGLDNEWENCLDYSPWAKKQFHAWLKKVYGGDIQALDEAWGTAYKAFDQAEPPNEDNCQSHPGAWLDWHRFQGENFTDVYAKLYKVLHENDPHHRPVASKITQTTIERPIWAKRRPNIHALLAEKTRPYSGGLYGMDAYGSGDLLCYETNYVYNCIRPMDRRPGYGVFLPETNNHSGPGWQWGATFWRLLSNGLKAVNFFCQGGIGRTGDFDTYGHVAPSGEPRGKMFYAARWAHMVHRTERLWTQSVPAPDLPRVAILYPHRDALLADNPTRSVWAYGANNRLTVYTWLREQGYWVDVIPYTKLAPTYVDAYDALVLINAEHLSAEECTAVKDYVKAGGVLVADTRPGFYDEHHRERHGLDDCLGSEVGNLSSRATDIWFLTDGGVIRGDVLVSLKPKEAKVLFRTTRGQTGVLTNQYGRGKVIHFATKLGFLRPEAPAPMLVSSWLGNLLKQAGVPPAYRVCTGSPADLESLRLEQPHVDAKGNCLLSIGNLSKQTVSPCVIEIALPDEGWTHAWWSPATDAGLQELALEQIGDGRYRIALPAVFSGALVYLLKDHAPLLGIPRIISERRSVDGYAPFLSPGKSFHVTVQLVNPVAKEASEGKLRLLSLRDWKVEPRSVVTPKLTAFGRAEFQFTVTPPAEHEKLNPDCLYPLVARWSDGEKDKAVCGTNVQLAVDRSLLPHLLSENTSYSDTSPWKIKTGATYTYLAPDKSKRKDPCVGKHPAEDALTNGAKGWWTSQAIFSKANLVDVLFDLKSDYEIIEVKLARGAPSYPEGFTVLTSSDGKTFTKQASVSAKKQGWKENKWLSGKLNHVPAQYVRIQVHMPGGGYIDEIEIWGRRMRKQR